MTTFTGLGGIEGYVSANRVVIVIDKEGVVQHPGLLKTLVSSLTTMLLFHLQAHCELL